MVRRTDLQLGGHRFKSQSFQFHVTTVVSCSHMPALRKVKVKVSVDLYSALSCDHTSKALRYCTCSQGISQFYLHTPHSFANGMNHTCLCLPS